MALEMNGQKKTADLIASVPAELTLNPLELCWQQYFTYAKNCPPERVPTLSQRPQGEDAPVEADPQRGTVSSGLKNVTREERGKSTEVI